VVIADAIRFGNGMGDVPDGPNGAGNAGGTTSGKPREDEAALLWVIRGIGQGINTSTFFSVTGNDPNVSAPARMAEEMNANSNPFGTSVYIAIHSNAFNGTARGAIGLISNSGPSYIPTPHQTDLATYLGQQVNDDMFAINGTFDYNWQTRSPTLTGAYGEINNDDFINSSGVVEMDASLAEVGFHDNVQDANIMRDPRGRDAIARSLYQAILQYFDVWGGLVSPVSLPTAPTNVRAVSNASGQVTINWTAGPSSPSFYGAAADEYRIYASTDGYGFDGGSLVTGGATSVTLSGYDPSLPYYFKVVAMNDGGESLASEVVTVLPSGGAKQVLIVNGFDRNHLSQNFRYTTQLTIPGSNVTVDRVWGRYNNSFDYVVQVHNAINAAEPGLHVDSTSNEAVINGSVNLTDYDTVIWILGEESTANDTFNATEQTKVQQFIAAGGNLFLSGSEIAWDLDAQSGGVSFYENTLKANYVADDANTYNITPAAGSIFAGMANFSFSNGNAFSSLDGQLYNVDSPDVISPQAGAVAALTYNGGAGGAAAIQVQGTGGNGSIVMLAFPFETITNAARRTDVMDRVLDFFAVSATTPAVDIKTQVNGQDADSPTGPILAAGSTATFTYTLTNPGNVPLTGVAVSDDNGTPGNPGDDFVPSFTGGDTNVNNQLDVGETWTYTALRTIIAGQYSNIGSVAAVGGVQNVADTDPANHFGSAPAVNITTLVGGNDADTPTGPVIPGGSFVVFSYQISNAGNIALSGIVVTDDNGTPGNAADDFTPSFSGGDANGNNLLDLGEVWTYVHVGTATAGQYAGSGSVSAVDSISQVVVNSDASHYFGSVSNISIESFINDNDADSPPGPTLTIGSTATLTYVVANTGNVALENVTVRDNNGTPFNAADDFSPTLTNGDTNSNMLLDPDEIWTFSALLVVAPDQQTHDATATANEEELVAYDATNYFGVAPENADFNGDSTVDAADYVVWRKFAGTTVPAGTLGDANYDTDVDDDDYVIYQQQFGSSPGGGGSGGASYASTSAPLAASSTEPSAAVREGAVSQDAAFSALATSGVDVRAFSRPSARPQARSIAAAVRDEWPALLAAMAEQKVAQQDEPDVLGVRCVDNRAIEILPAGLDLAHVKVFARAKLQIRK